MICAEEGLMVLGKCGGEQRLEQVRGQLLWSALTGCGFANTWTECLRPDSARLQKCGKQVSI